MASPMYECPPFPGGADGWDTTAGTLALPDYFGEAPPPSAPGLKQLSGAAWSTAAASIRVSGVWVPATLKARYGGAWY